MYLAMELSPQDIQTAVETFGPEFDALMCTIEEIESSLPSAATVTVGLGATLGGLADGLGGAGLVVGGGGTALTVGGFLLAGGGLVGMGYAMYWSMKACDDCGTSGAREVGGISGSVNQGTGGATGADPMGWSPTSSSPPLDTMGKGGRQKGRGDDPAYDMDPEQLKEAIEKARGENNSQRVKNLERIEKMNGDRNRQKRKGQ
jgi:hypothetical protein